MDEFTHLCKELKELLNQPLPGGRGFQAQRDRRIQRLGKLLGEAQLPER